MIVMSLSIVGIIGAMVFWIGLWNHLSDKYDVWPWYALCMTIAIATPAAVLFSLLVAYGS
jgi:O-antigen/teichoic acid export membrane protein